MPSRSSLVFVVVVVALAPTCAAPTPGQCGEGEGEGALFGPTLDGVAAPADFGTLPVNGILHVAARNQGVPVTASLRIAGFDDTERPIDVDEVGPVMRILPDGLDADTSYVATLRMNSDNAAVGAQTVRELSFTTTDAVDNTPAVFAGEPTIDIVRSVDGTECSGPGTLVNVVAPEILDDSGVAGVKLLAVDVRGARTLVAFHLGPGNVVDTRETGIDAAYVLVAVDVAGNESAPLGVDVNTVAGCSASGGSPTLAAFALWSSGFWFLRRRRGAWAA